MDSFNPAAPSTLQSNSAAPRGNAPSDSTGISHPTTYESGVNNTDGNIKSSQADHHAAAAMQANINTPMSQNNSTQASGTSQPIGSGRQVPSDGGRQTSDREFSGQDRQFSNQDRQFSQREGQIPESGRQLSGQGRQEEGRHTEGHSEGHSKKDKVKSEADPEASHGPRKTHEETTREIKATQEKAMSGTHEASKQGESLRKEVEDEEQKGSHNDGEF